MTERGGAPRVAYRERSPWSGTRVFLYWFAVAGLAAALMLGSAWPRTPLAWGAGLLAAAWLGWTGWILFVGLTVEVRTDGVRFGMGNGAVLRKVVPYRDIVALESVTYRPIREFGGWGVRGRGDKRAWTARGNRAVVLQLRDGTRIYVGSDAPARLEERIRARLDVPPSPSPLPLQRRHP